MARLQANAWLNATTDEDTPKANERGVGVGGFVSEIWSPSGCGTGGKKLAGSRT